MCLYIVLYCTHTLADLKEYRTALANYEKATTHFKQAYKDSFNKTEQLHGLQKKTSQELQVALSKLQEIIATYKIPDITCGEYDYICHSTFYFTKVKKYMKIIENQYDSDYQNIKTAYEEYDKAVQKSTKYFLKAVKEKQTADKVLDKATKKLAKTREEYSKTCDSCGWLLSCQTQHGVVTEVNRLLTVLTSVNGDSSSDKPPQKKPAKNK